MTASCRAVFSLVLCIVFLMCGILGSDESVYKPRLGTVGMALMVVGISMTCLGMIGLIIAFIMDLPKKKDPIRSVVTGYSSF